MPSCPWLYAHCPKADALLNSLEDCVMPSAMAAVDAVEDGIACLSDQARAKPVQSLLVAGAAGLVLGLMLSRRRG